MLELYNTSMHSSNKNNNNNTHNNRKHAISKKKPTKSTHVPTACVKYYITVLTSYNSLTYVYIA